MADSLKNLSDNLKMFLARKGMSKTKFCELAGIDRGGLNNYLNLQTSPTLEILDRISEVVGVKPSELIESEKDKHNLQKIVESFSHDGRICAEKLIEELLKLVEAEKTKPN
jgi:transcriptional regulator with XRE-family HTH domain